MFHIYNRWHYCIFSMSHAHQVSLLFPWCFLCTPGVPTVLLVLPVDTRCPTVLLVSPVGTRCPHCFVCVGASSPVSLSPPGGATVLLVWLVHTRFTTVLLMFPEHTRCPHCSVRLFFPSIHPRIKVASWARQVGSMPHLTSKLLKEVLLEMLDQSSTDQSQCLCDIYQITMEISMSVKETCFRWAAEIFDTRIKFVYTGVSTSHQAARTRTCENL